MISFHYDPTLTSVAFAVIPYDGHKMIVVNPTLVSALPYYLQEHLTNSMMANVRNHRRSTKARVINLCLERESRRPVEMTGTR